MAPSWPLRSSQLNTASVYYLRDRSRFSLFSSTLFLYYPCSRFLYVYVSSVSSCTRAAVAATQQPTAIQQQHHNDNSSSSTSVSTRGRQRKQARMKEQVNCCREPAMYEYFIFLFSPFFVVPSSFTTYNIRKTRKILDFSKYG